VRAVRFALVGVVAVLAFLALRDRYDLTTSIIIVAAAGLLVARLVARFAARRRRSAGP
jgi:FtsH-binding integral membrane protein